MCGLQQIYQDPFRLYIFIEVILLILVLIPFFTLWKNYKNFWLRLMSGPFLIAMYIFISFVLTILFTFTFWIDDHRSSVVFFQMNAAIKNTCYVDKTRANCPKNLSQLINLYPQDFKPLQEKYVFTYKYDEIHNIYTLIARPKNIMLFKNRLAIFDPRLTNTNNSYDTPGLDFADAKAYSCNGKFKLESPPPFEGPWDNIN